MLEGTELYTELQKAVTEYAKTKGEYQSRYDALAELYKNIENADIDAELTADLVGDYLFTDADFVNNLSANHRNVFQKIYDEVKYLCKIATAGSKEARQLEKVKKTFEDAFRAETKNTAQEGGVKYSLNEFEDGQRFVSVETDQNLFDNLSTKEQTDLATKIIKERYQGKVIGIDNRAFVNGKTADEYTHPAKHLDSDIYEAKMRASTELDNLMDAGFNFRNDSDGKYGHTHSDVTGGFDYFDVIFKVGGEYYQGVINIKNINRGKLLKDITQIRNITQDVTSRYGSNPSYAFLRDASMNSISQNSEKSTQNIKNSLSTQNDDLGPIGDYNVYGKDVALEGSLPDDFAPVAETPNSQTSVDLDEVLDNEAEWTYNIPEPKYETHRSFAETVVDKISAEEIENGVNKAIREYAINEDESVSLQAYVAGAAYDMTRAQRSGDRSEQSEYETYLEESVRSGLMKHPKYTGLTYRNLDFDTVFNSENDFDSFLSINAEGNIVDLDAFTSASKEPNGYPTIGEKSVHLVIYGQSARDISETYNGQQQEVIYLPGTKYRVVRVTTANDGNPLIYGKEIVSNEVQELQGNTSSTEPINGIEGIPQGQEYDNDRVSNVGRVYERAEGPDQLSKAVQMPRSRTSETQAERNEIAPLGKASSEDGVFFDGENIDDDLGPIGETPIQTVKDKLEARLGNLNTELNNVRLRLIGNIVHNYVLFGDSILTVS